MEFNDQVELLKDYLEEAFEFADLFDARLLELEQASGREPDPDLLKNVLSALHTFKGNSGMMGYVSLQKYAHKLEDLFKGLQAGTLELNDTLVEFLMLSASVIRHAVSGLSPEHPTEPSLHDDLAYLEQVIAEHRQDEPAAAAPTGPAREAPRTLAKKTNVLKVDFERLDHLLNLMGELVIYRTRLGRVEAQFRESIGEKGLCLELSDTAEQIGKATTELHEAIMKVRMLPLRHVFNRFPRLVRDLGREKGKEIGLHFEGEEVELDKTVIDEIGEPLLHLLRNAIDHGIETPEDRERLGKSRQGTITLRAYQESSHIMIMVEDDGRGIDVEGLREKAERLGLLPKGEHPAKDLLNLIFLPGLSTAREVTEVSGRGLGMDVVKHSLAKINGAVEVESEPGVGTRFTIKLPLTLAIVSALLVEASGEAYAIPLASVVESVKIAGAEIHQVNHREVAKIRERILPLARLSDRFGLPRSPLQKNTYVVIVQSSAGQMGLIVDSLLGRQEIVIKTLDDYLGDSPGVAGATILGDGKVVLIVDVAALVQAHGLQAENRAVREALHA